MSRESTSEESTASAEQAPKRRGVRLTEAEAWEMLADGHTGIFTTLRRDGTPISLPVWFAVVDRTIYLSTPGTAKKLSRIRNNARSSFLVETGKRWAHLKAVLLTGTSEVIDDSDETLDAKVRAELDRKYADFRTSSAKMPAATRSHYAKSALVRFTSDERFISWDNSLLGLE